MPGVSRKIDSPWSQSRFVDRTKLRLEGLRTTFPNSNMVLPFHVRLSSQSASSQFMELHILSLRLTCIGIFRWPPY